MRRTNAKAARTGQAELQPIPDSDLDVFMKFGKHGCVELSLTHVPINIIIGFSAELGPVLKHSDDMPGSDGAFFSEK